MRLTIVIALCVAALSVVATAGCGAPKSACTPQSCAAGCCSATGECLSGGENSACGTNGNACSSCAQTAQICGDKVCISATIDAGTFECTRTPLKCSDQTISSLDLKSNVATGLITNGSDAVGFKATVNATGGGFTPTESYVYARFTDLGLEKVALDDMAAIDSMDWDIAFRRYVIRINSGDSGPSCVAAQVQPGTYESITAVPAGYLPEGDDFLRKVACTFIDDGSGLGTSPRTALSAYYQYAGCVSMTGKPFVLTTHTGRHVKLVVTTYYATEAAQTTCDSTMSSGGAVGGTVRMRWTFLD